jgi:uncharacterized protein
MKAAAFDPRRLDVAAFARAGATLAGETSIGQLPRLRDSASDPAAAAPVTWRAEGRWDRAPGGEGEPVMRLMGQATVPLTCQRCLQPLVQDVSIDRAYRFVATEAQAEALDLGSDDEVLSLGGTLDVLALVEDELILALPLVPRHAACPQPLASPDAAERAGNGGAHPFAVLAGLRRRDEGEC